MAGRGTSSRDWWPNQLNLRILHQNSPLSNPMGEAFNFGAILETIGKIGWGTYIVALIVLVIVQFVIGIVLSIIAMIPVLGAIIQFVLFAPLVIFEYRYICQIYDAAGV